MRFAPCQLRPRSTYVGTSGDGQGLDVGTGEAIDVASQVSRGDISDGVVVRGNTDVIVLALIDLDNALSAQPKESAKRAVLTPLSQIYCIVTYMAKLL